MTWHPCWKDLTQRKTTEKHTDMKFSRITAMFIMAVSASLLAPMKASGQKDSLIVRAEGSQLRIEAAGFGITLGKDGSEFSNAYQDKPYRHSRVSTSLGSASFDLGFNVLTGVDYYGQWEDKGDFLDMHGWRSVRVGWVPIAVEVALDRRGTVSFVAGLKLTADNYMFSQPYTLKENPDGILMPYKLEGNIKKSKLTATYIGIPIQLSFKVSNDVYISGHVCGDLLLKAHTKYKKPKVKDNISGLSPFRLSAGGSISFGCVGIFCDYGITSLFKDNIGADAHTLSIGLRLGL